jgi:hypothetical protein
VAARGIDRREFLRLAGVMSLSSLAACVVRDTSEEPAKPLPSPADAPSPSPAEPTETGPSLAWRRIDAKGPGPRRDYSFASAGAGAPAFLFGGRAGGEALGDLWSFTEGRWREISGKGPAPRFGHNAVVIGSQLLLFGGQGGRGVFFNDLWEFDVLRERWTRLAGEGPAPSPRYASAGTAVGTEFTISHGFTDAGRFDDTWSFSSGWKDVSPRTGPRPIKRCLHRLVNVKALGRLVLFGGQTNGEPFLGDTWLYEPQARAWTEVKGPSPGARNVYAAAAADDALYLFGGNGSAGPLGDLWSFDGEQWKKESPGEPRPSARSGVDFAALGGSMLLFGGSDASGELDDLWELTLS